MSNGAPLTPWQRAVIAEWHRRNPQPVEMTYGTLTVRCVPRGAYCLGCGTQGVQFPADDLKAKIASGADCNGYFICPQCSVRIVHAVGPES
jgi:hypothetical protein